MDRNEFVKTYGLSDKLTNQQRTTVKASLIFAVILACTAIAFGRPAFIEASLSNQLHDGEIAQGTILKMRSDGGDTPSNYFMTYQLDPFVDGTNTAQFTRESRIEEHEYYDLSKGDKILIRYSRTDPTIFIAETTYNNLVSNYFGLIGAFCLFGAGIMMAIIGLLGTRFDTLRYYQDLAKNPNMMKPVKK